MRARRTVVRNCSTLSKPQLHALLMEGWARAIAKLGKGLFADHLEISAPALDKQLTGSMPGFDCIDKAFDADDSVLDEWAAEKGKRIVAKEAVCDVDDLRLLIARVMLKMQEVTHPDSPGGAAIVHSEYLDGETLMRELHGATGEWLARCSEIRRPRAVAK
jgi:hypothetical protein